MRIVAGVDCHKASHAVVFLDAIGHVVEQLTIPTTEAGYERALDVSQRLGCAEWGLEGSGCYGYAFAVYAAARGATVFEVPGVMTKRQRRHGSRRGKSDENDAYAIAHVVLREQGRLPTFHLATMQRALRLRYDRRDRFVRERTRAANRLRMSGVLIGVMELPADVTPMKTARRLAASAARLRDAVAHNLAATAIVDDLQDAAEEIVRLNAKIVIVERELRPLTRQVAAELLELHGISAVVAAGLIGHAGDMRNFRNAAAFAAKCGVAPVACSSGRNVAVRVNTGGDRQMNRLLHIIAMAQVRAREHVGRRYYERKRTEGKTHLAAMRCLKRQLATIVFYRLCSVAAVLNPPGAELRIAA